MLKSKETDRPESQPTSAMNKSISIATIIMMSSVLLSRIIGLLREMVLAQFGGTSYEMDAYVTSFIIPELLNHFLAGGFLSITYIPIFQRHLINNRRDKAWESFSNLFCIGSLIFVICIPVLILLTPNFLAFLGPKIRDPRSFSITVKLTRIIIPAQLFFYWGALFNAVQMAQKRFLLPALAPLGYNGGIILGGWILGPMMGIEGFAWGVLSGAFVGNVLIQLPGALRCGMKLFPQCNFKHPDIITYFKKTVPLILGLSMTFSNELFFRYFGSFLSDGSTASVNYALRTMMITVAVFGQASGVAFYPFLTKLAVEKKFKEMEQLLNNVLRKIALFLIPISALLIILSHQVIAFLFERGKFNAQSTADTAPVLVVYLFGCFAYCVAIIMARSFYAMQKMVLPLVISSSIALGTVPLYVLFSSHFGARGIAAAAVFGMTVQGVLLYSIWIKKYGTLQTTIKELIIIVKVIAITLIGTIVGFIIRRWLQMNLPFDNVLIRNGCIIVVVTLPMLFVVFLLYDKFGLQKWKESYRGMFRRQ
jgi:putative peptidoglycan lipid II flippase